MLFCKFGCTDCVSRVNISRISNGLENVERGALISLPLSLAWITQEEKNFSTSGSFMVGKFSI